MSWNLLIAGAMFLGQAAATPARNDRQPPGRWIAPAAATQAPMVAAPAVPAMPVRSSPRSATTPPDMIAEALALRPGSVLAGQPLTLAAALGATTDRRQQIEVTHAYWRLAGAVVAYNCSLDHQQQLQQLPQRPDSALLLRSALTSSAAALREAESAVVAAQHELAAALVLPAGAPLPLPADRPHVGPYRTNYTELAALGSATPRTRLIDQTLPYLRRAIDLRASAVDAAREALAAALDAYQAGRGDLSAPLSCANEMQRQRKAFADVVCRYNDQIADYALIVARGTVAAPALAGMLIEPPREPVRSTIYEDDGSSGRRPTVPIETAPAMPPRAIVESIPGSVIPVVPREPAAAPRQQTSTPVPPAISIPAPSGNQPAAPPSGPSSSVVPGGLPSYLLRRPAESEPGTPQSSTAPQLRTANRIAADGAVSPANALSQALYPGLVQTRPAVQARQLAATLHWDRSLPEGLGEPIRLAECLRGRSAVERWPVLAAFWVARYWAAECQAFAQQAELLDNLSAVAAARDAAGQVATAPRLRTLQRAAQAAVEESRASLLEAEFELAGRIGRESSARWPLPSTIPHTAACLLKTTPAPEMQNSPVVQRSGAMLPLLQTALEARGAAVVEADVARATLTAQYETGTGKLESVLAAIGQQAAETTAFVRLAADYNQALGQYALAVLPPTVSSDQLAAALVTEETAPAPR